MNREDLIEKFHKAFGAAINEPPTAELLKLRKTLLLEEMHELIEELDTAIDLLERGTNVPNDRWAAMLKEMGDLQVVLSGTSVSLAPLQRLNEAFERIHASNMSKLGDDGKPVLRDDGKVLKGPQYIPPDLMDLV